MNGTEAVPKKWFVLRVQSGKEDTIKRNLEKRVKAAGLGEQVGRVLVPAETVAEIRRGKRTERKRKKFPGYIFVEMEADEKSQVARLYGHSSLKVGWSNLWKFHV